LKHIAASDLQRRDDFLGTLYGSADTKIPLNVQTFMPDMVKVTDDYGTYIDPELSELLTHLKNKRLGS
jgi:hypothetical protein